MTGMTWWKKRLNSSVSAVELHLYYIKPSTWSCGIIETRGSVPIAWNQDLIINFDLNENIFKSYCKRDITLVLQQLRSYLYFALTCGRVKISIRPIGNYWVLLHKWSTKWPVWFRLRFYVQVLMVHVSASMRLENNCPHLADNIFKWIFMEEKFYI